MRKNPYNAEYIMQRENLNRDDAEKFIENYKLNKATSLKGFIHRHGEVKGTEMFEKFKQTSVSRTASAFSTMEEYTKFNREGSKFCVEYWLKHFPELTEEEAAVKVSEYQLANAGVNREVYRRKGKTEKEIDEILGEINRRKTIKIKSLSYSVLLEKGLDVFDSYYLLRLVKSPLDSMRLHLLHKKDEEAISFLDRINIADNVVDFILDNLIEAIGIARTLENTVSNKLAYRTIVESLTKQNDLTKLSNFGRLDEYGRVYELDHIYSISDGFKNKIHPFVLAHPSNLRYISKFENGTKFSNSEMTLTELYKLTGYKQNENKISNFNWS